MNDFDPQPRDDADPMLPKELTDDLVRLYSTPSHASPAVDAAIRFAAADHFRKRFVRRRTMRWVLGWSSAAAAAIVGLTLRFGPWTRKPSPPPNLALASVEKDDLNLDGKVDILDAFFLARQLKGRTPPDPAWDINGDGVVDQRDVDALAARAVSLGRGGMQ